MESESFLQLGSGVDERSYYKQIIDDAVSKADQTPYSERRLAEINAIGNDDFCIEDEYELAMEEITTKEKDLSQLIQVTNFLFERNEELQDKHDENARTVETYQKSTFDNDSKFQLLIDDVDQKIAKIEILEQHNHELERDLAELTTQGNKLRHKVREMEDVAHVNLDLKSRLEEQLARREEELQNLSLELEEKLPSMQNDINDLQQELSLERKGKNAAEKELEKVKKDLEASKSKEKTLSMTGERYAKQCRQMRKDLKKGEEIQNELQQEIERLKLAQEASAMMYVEEQAPLEADPDLEQFEDNDGQEDQNDDDGQQQINTNVVENEHEQVGGDDLGNELMDQMNELEALNGDGFQENGEADYVETDVYQKRQSRFVSSDILSKLNEYEEPKRMSNTGMGQSFIGVQEVIKPQVQLCDSETQTDSPPEKEMYEMETQTESVTTATMKTQTEKLKVSNGSCQTTQVRTSSEQVQTDRKVEASQGVQCRMPAHEIDCQTSFETESMETDSEHTSEQSMENRERSQSHNDFSIKQAKTIPMTAKAGSRPQTMFDGVASPTDTKSKAQLSTGVSSNETSNFNRSNTTAQLNEQYLQNRDPMKEFFTLTCQSVKIMSPHMNIICTLSVDALYQKALSENIPFFNYWKWIESTIQKEVFSQLCRGKNAEEVQKIRAKEGSRAGVRASFRHRASMRGEIVVPKLNKKEKMKKSLAGFLGKIKNRNSGGDAEESKKQAKSTVETIKEEAKEEDDIPEITPAQKRQQDSLKKNKLRQDTPKKPKLGPPTTF